MPDNARPGNYTLRIEGTLNGGMSGNIFENETKLVFDTKQCSMFITTNKPVYMQGQEGNSMSLHYASLFTITYVLMIPET